MPTPAAVEAALATASSFQAAYLHLQAAHAPFLPEAAAAADAAAVSHLRRLSELKRIAWGAPADAPGPDGGGTLTAHLEAQVRENQALLRSFDAVVNRLQAALDAKDSAAAALRLDLEALDDVNAQLSARLDRALAPPPGGDAVAPCSSRASSTPSSAARSVSPTDSPARSPRSSGALGGTWPRLRRLPT